MQIKPKAKSLYKDGFSVIPVGANKAPLIENWTAYKTDRIEPNGLFDSPNVKGCGVVTGQKIGNNYLAAIDVDCYRKHISRSVCEYIVEIAGQAMPYRIGEAPKFLVPVLLDASTKKILSNEYQEANNKKSRIEILCDGQQFVAFGEHAQSQAGAYKWYNGKLSISTLPVLNLDQVHKIIDYFEYSMQQENAIVVSKATKSSLANGIEGIDDVPIDISIDKIKSTLKLIPADIDHDTWNRVGMALHHQFGGSNEGFTLWDEWSKTAPEAYQKGLTALKWESYGNNDGTPIRFASVISLSKQYKDTAINSVFETPIVSFEQDNVRFTQINDTTFASQKMQKWLVKGIIEQQTVGAIYGPPKTGKSFIAIDLALHIAHGLDWCERKVKAGPVAYIAGEGTLGVERRIAAWRIEHKIQGASDFYLSKQNFILTDEEQLKILIASLDTIHKTTPLSMIVIDTYARALGGEVDENATGETGKVIKILDRIKDRYKACVCIIHHSPKGNSATLRGSGALQGALDMSMSVSKNNETVVVTCRDQKDASDFGDLGFKLISYELPDSMYIDNFGETVNTAVARYDSTASIELDAKLSPSGQAILRAFKDEMGMPKALKVAVPADIIKKYGLDASSEGLYIDDVKERFYRQQDGGAEASTNRNKWKRGLDNCVEKECLEVLDNIIFELK